MTNDDLSIETSGAPRVIKLGYGDSIVVDNEEAQPKPETLIYIQGHLPDPDIYSIPIFEPALQVGERRH